MFLGAFVAVRQKNVFLRVKTGVFIVQIAIKRCDCMLVWCCGML